MNKNNAMQFLKSRFYPWNGEMSWSAFAVFQIYLHIKKE